MNSSQLLPPLQGHAHKYFDVLSADPIFGWPLLTLAYHFIYDVVLGGTGEYVVTQAGGPPG